MRQKKNCKKKKKKVETENNVSDPQQEIDFLNIGLKKMERKK